MRIAVSVGDANLSHVPLSRMMVASLESVRKTRCTVHRYWHLYIFRAVRRARYNMSPTGSMNSASAFTAACNSACFSDITRLRDALMNILTLVVSSKLFLNLCYIYFSYFLCVSSFNFV